MRIESFKNYTEVHTWTGIISGLFLYVCFVAGALTMFQGPLNQWVLQAPSQLPAIAPDQYDSLVQQVLTDYPAARKALLVHLPVAGPQPAPASWQVEDEASHAVSHYYASLDSQGRLLVSETRASALGDFMDDLHRTAGIPGELGHEAFGTLVLGLVAGLYFVALVSGLIIFLPSWLKDLFALRRGQNRKRFWLDFHNILGISALPFHLVIALTTFVFAYHDLIYDSLGGWVYQDQPLFNRPAPGPAHGTDQLLPVARLVQAARDLQPGFEPAELLYMNLESPGARVRVGGLLPGELVRGADHTYTVGNPYTADFNYNNLLPDHADGYSRAVVSFFALHFGNFGGQTIRWVYFGLGISGALLFLTGNILWIEARRKRQKAQTRSSRIMARLTVGVAAGSLLGIALAFACAKYLPHHRLDISFWQQFGYYAGFFGGLGWAFVRKPLQAARELLIATATLVLLLPLADLLGGSALLPGPAVAINLLALAVAGGLLATWRWLTRRSRAIAEDSVWAL